MLRLILCRVIRYDRIRHAFIRNRIGMAIVADKMMENGFKLFCHIMKVTCYLLPVKLSYVDYRT